MSILTSRIKVRDFGDWKKSFDSYEPVREKAGLKLITLLRSVDAPNDILITLEAKDIRKAKEYFASEELKQTMIKGGVLGPPEVFIGNTV